MRYLIELGDSSGDGHSISENIYVNIEGAFTEEELAQNYEKNVQKLGFSFKDIADDYDRPTISSLQIEALTNAGLTFKLVKYTDDILMYLDKTTTAYQKTILLEDFNDEAATDFYFAEKEMNFESYIRIIMFFIGDGLKDFWWNFEPIRSKKLVGMGGVVHANAGYGFFGT